jgi:hypothetical protein
MRLFCARVRDARMIAAVRKEMVVVLSPSIFLTQQPEPQETNNVMILVRSLPLRIGTQRVKK